MGNKLANLGFLVVVSLIFTQCANKYIKIKILDTLQANTTYAFNFGESIADNNEGNLFPYYKYVFSMVNKARLQEKHLDLMDHKFEGMFSFEKALEYGMIDEILTRG